ncbi:MAG: ParA family protein, partial [Synergistaceae bacterium]|nr:ParA family protein [Synergistaceae bacterium]
VAQELKSRGFQVLLIDTDAQCNSTKFYEARTEQEATVLDIFCGDEPALNCVQHTAKGDIIASDKLLSDAETMVKVDERRFTHLKRSLKSLEDKYDYVIVDTPSSIGVALKNVLVAVDYVIIPVEESGWSLDGLMDFAQALDLARDNNEKLKVAGILVVKAKERTRKSKRIGELAVKVAEKLGSKCFKTKIRESVSCTEALTEYFVPLNEYAPDSTTNEDYKNFVNELLEEISDG